MIYKNENGDLVIAQNKPGYEATPFGGVLGFDLNADGNSVGWDGPLELGFGGSLVVAGYGGVMEALNLLPAYRAGLITKRELAMASLHAAWGETKDKAAVILVGAIIVSILPGTAPIFALAGVIGGGIMSVRLIKQFAAALSDEQLADIKAAASKSGVVIPGLTDKQTPTDNTNRGTAAGYDEIDPIPSAC